MAIPGLGVNSGIQIKKETVYGTPIVGNYNKIPHRNVDYAADTTFLESDAITTSGSRAAAHPGIISYAGPLTCEAGYEGMDQLINNMLGKSTASTPTGGTTTRDKWHEVIAAPPSHTHEVNYGDIPADDKVFIFVGCYMESLEISLTAPGYLQFSAGIVPWKETSTASTGSTAQTTAATYTHRPVPTYHATIYDLGPGSATTYCLTSGRIRMTRPVKRDRACLGAATAKEAIIVGLFDVNCEFEVEFSDRAIYDDFVAKTLQTTGQLKFVSDEVIEGALKYEIEFKFPRFYLIGPATPTIDGAAEIKQRFGFRGFGTGGTGAGGTPDETSTKEPIAIRTRNTILTTAY